MDFSGVDDGAIGEGSGEDEDGIGNERLGAHVFWCHFCALLMECVLVIIKILNCRLINRNYRLLRCVNRNYRLL